jgi:hypothetical protein
MVDALEEVVRPAEYKDQMIDGGAAQLGEQLRRSQ